MLKIHSTFMLTPKNETFFNCCVWQVPLIIHLEKDGQETAPTFVEVLKALTKDGLSTPYVDRLAPFGRNSTWEL